MVFENAQYKDFARHKRIVCAHGTVMLSDNVFNKLLEGMYRKAAYLITVGDFRKIQTRRFIKKQSDYW